jgi:hypothetical protein
VLAASLKALARARDSSRAGNDTSPTALQAALLQVAAAAITRRDRLDTRALHRQLRRPDRTTGRP